jgi:hypothetical protein
MTPGVDPSVRVTELTPVNCAARALAAALEPVIGSVYFSPECHAAYAALGFGPSPGPVTGDGWAESHWGRVAMPDGVAYFASRGGLLGRVRGEVVAAAFGVFNPDIVVPAVEAAWRIADPDDIVAARREGAVAQLVRILGPSPAGIGDAADLLATAVAALNPAGHPMFAGASAQPVPADPVARMWHLGDRLREHRGDAHVNAFSAAGFDGCRFQVLTERCAGMPPRTYSAGRGWSPAQLDEAEGRLTVDGLLQRSEVTAKGRAVREAVEVATDDQCRPSLDALGDDVVRLIATMLPWGEAIRAADGYYPTSPQLATMSPVVDDWMVVNGLPPFCRPA